MSLPLDDLKRLKITNETMAYLESEARESGRTKQEVLRDEMHKIAIVAVRKAKLLLALAPSEGHDGDSQGQSGSRRK
jgi:hypothetical protein